MTIDQLRASRANILDAIATAESRIATLTRLYTMLRLTVVGDQRVGVAADYISDIWCEMGVKAAICALRPNQPDARRVGMDFWLVDGYPDHHGHPMVAGSGPTLTAATLDAVGQLRDRAQRALEREREALADRDEEIADMEAGL